MSLSKALEVRNTAMPLLQESHIGEGAGNNARTKARFWSSGGHRSTHSNARRASRPRQSFWAGLIATAFLLFSGSDLGAAGGRAEPDFTVRGSICVTNAYTSSSQDFQVDVNGDRWLIKSRPAGMSVSGIEVGCEGNGVIYRLEPAGGAAATAFIESNTVPADVGGLVPMIYTFFCTARTLSDSGAGYLPPAYDPEVGVLFNPALRRYARWDLWDESSWVYRRLAYYSKQPDRTEDTRGAAPADERGLLAEFRITSVTNWNGQSVPLTGEYRRFDPAKTPATILANGAFTSAIVSMLEATHFEPALSAAKGVGVVDRRLYQAGRTNRVMNYLFNGAEWPSVQSAEALSTGQRRTPVPPPKLRGARKLVIACVLIPLAIPLAALWGSRRGSPGNRARSPSAPGGDSQQMDH
jgi:hypothetical protein